MTEETPAGQCRAAAATLRDRRLCKKAWLVFMPDNAAESLAAWLDDAALWEPVEAHVLGFARAVNGSTP